MNACVKKGKMVDEKICKQCIDISCTHAGEPTTKERLDMMNELRMKNVSMTVEGNVLTITVDLAKTFGRSKSGKTEIIATTAGNRPIPGSDAKIGLNIYR